MSRRRGRRSDLPYTEPAGLRQEGAAVRALLPYLWPKGELDMKARVVTAMVLLVAAKLATVYVPVLYKLAIDALTVTGSATSDVPAVVTVPVGLILGFGLVRVLGDCLGSRQRYPGR